MAEKHLQPESSSPLMTRMMDSWIQDPRQRGSLEEYLDWLADHPVPSTSVGSPTTTLDALLSRDDDFTYKQTSLPASPREDENPCLTPLPSPTAEEIEQFPEVWQMYVVDGHARHEEVPSQDLQAKSATLDCSNMTLPATVQAGLHVFDSRTLLPAPPTITSSPSHARVMLADSDLVRLRVERGLPKYRKNKAPVEAYGLSNAEILAEHPEWLYGERLLTFLLEYDLEDLTIARQVQKCTISLARKHAIQDRAAEFGIDFQTASEEWHEERRLYRLTVEYQTRLANGVYANCSRMVMCRKNPAVRRARPAMVVGVQSVEIESAEDQGLRQALTIYNGTH